MKNDILIRGAALRMGEGQHKVVCPICSPERKKKKERTLSLKVSDEGILYNCWHCSANGVVALEERFMPVKRSNKVSLAVQHNWDELNDNTIKWLKGRGISEDTARKAKIKSGIHYIGALQKQTDCVVFPYTNQGQIYAAKIRSLSDKGFACNGAPASFFNLDSVVSGDDLFICEGEMDVLAMMEAGFESCVSVPNGAVMKVVDGKIDPQEDNKFKFLWDAKKKIDRAHKIIIATDSDGAGQAMAEEIARRIGKDKCWKIQFPDDCKDANDVLIKHGKKGLEKSVKEVVPWPVAGLYDASHFYDELDEIYEKGMGKGASTGYSNVDEYYTIVEGQLTVVTGHPSSGKSEFIDQIMVNLAEKKGWNFAICSFENEPRLHIAKLISKHFAKPFFTGVTPRLTPEELERGKDFVREHFSFLYQNDGSLATIDGIVERLKVAVMRHGIRGAVIDPYNYIQKNGDISETDWISEMLTQLRVFSQSHGIHLWFVAHPTKMMRGTDGKVPPPKGYDISGSAAWFAKADIGLSVHRPDPIANAISEVHIWKCRFSWVGKQGVADLFFNPVTSRYSMGDDNDNFPSVPSYKSEDVPF
jgi:twinkle protein